MSEMSTYDAFKINTDVVRPPRADAKSEICRRKGNPLSLVILNEVKNQSPYYSA
jgi:hypothetical protein